MMISQKELWDSINRIAFPNKGFTAQECGYVLPDALKQAAVVMVRDDRFGEEYFKNPHLRMIDEQNVIDALRELRDNGFLNFIDSKE